jgi:hypothetical protein
VIGFTAITDEMVLAPVDVDPDSVHQQGGETHG